MYLCKLHVLLSYAAYHVSLGINLISFHLASDLRVPRHRLEEKKKTGILDIIIIFFFLMESFIFEEQILFSLKLQNYLRFNISLLFRNAAAMKWNWYY